MEELIKKMNLHTINVEGDFIISKEQLEAFAKMYHKEQLALYDVSNRDLYKELRAIGLTHDACGQVLDWSETLHGC